MRFSGFLVWVVIQFFSASGLAQVKPQEPTPFVRDQFCREVAMFFDLPLEKAKIDQCLGTSKVLTRVREKSPEIPLDIEGTATINKFVYVCQGAVRTKSRVVLKNCIELVLF